MYYHNTNEPLPNYVTRNNKISLDPGTPIRALFSNSSIENYEIFVNSTGREKGSVFGIINSNDIPVTLKTFQVKKIAPSMLEVSWEASIGYFVKETIIERSVGNPDSFVVIAKITTSNSDLNNSGMQSFSLPDTLKNLSYFRLKQLDRDNHVTYSNVIMVQYLKRPSSLNIYPNPVLNNQLRLLFTEARREEGTFEIYSLSGRRMLSQSSPLQKGGNFINIQVSFLPKGLYIIKMSRKGMTESVGSFLKL